MALQMRQQQQQQQQQQQAVNNQTSKNTGSSTEKPSDANKEVQQIDGYPPLLPQFFQVQDLDHCDDEDRGSLQSLNLSSRAVQRSEVECQPSDSTSHHSASCIDKVICTSGVSDRMETDRSVRAFEVPTLGKETIHLSKIKRNLCTQSEVTLSGKPTTKPARKGSARLPRRGDRVEFVIERTKGQSDSKQLDGLVKEQRVYSKGRRSKFIVQLDGGVDGSSSEDDSDLDDSSDVRLFSYFIYPKLASVIKSSPVRVKIPGENLSNIEINQELSYIPTSKCRIVTSREVLCYLKRRE